MSTAASRVGPAIAAGYLLGRFKKLRWALIVGSALANDEVRSRIGSALSSSQLVGSAADRLSDVLADRTDALNGFKPKGKSDDEEDEDEYEDDEAEDEYEDEEPEDEYEDEEEDEEPSKNGSSRSRRTASKR